MSMKKKIMNISIFFIVCSVLISAVEIICPNIRSSTIQILNFVVVTLGAIGSIISIFIPSSCVRYILPDDWVCEKDKWVYILPVEKHEMGKYPMSAVSVLASDGHYVPIWGQAKYNENGDVVLDFDDKPSKQFKITVK